MRQPNAEKLEVGDVVELRLEDPEKTAHLQGDTKHTSIYLGLGSLVGKIGTSL